MISQLVQIHPGFREAPGVVLHRFGNDSDYRVWREWVLQPHGAISFKTSQRNPTPLFGVGLIDAIPDEVIEAGAARRHPGWPQIKGRVSRTRGGKIGHFGWKAQTATLSEFIFTAAAVEMGLEVPGHHQAGDPRVPPLDPPGLDLDQVECAALIAFVRSLPAPEVLEPENHKAKRDIKAGKGVFRSLGCTECHVPKLGDVDGLYSDLLLHTMSRQLADTSSYGAFLAATPAPPGRQRRAVVPVAAAGRQPQAAGVGAAQAEWRTPPLWGLRDSAPYLHDGRAPSIEDAILMHGGEAAASAQRYRQLPRRDQRLLHVFLLSLAAPQPEAGVKRP